MDVILNVYDLSPYNYYVYFLGFGAYHSGLELGGVEYSFGGNDTDGTGVYEVPPRSEGMVVFRESILLGKTTATSAERIRILDQLRMEFTGRSYHVLRKNCNHFTNEFCTRLLNRSIPAFVNRGAGCISFFRCCLPPHLAGPPAVTRVEPQAVFKGSGIVIGGDDESLPETPEDRRKLLAFAVDRRLNG